MRAFAARKAWQSFLFLTAAAAVAVAVAPWSSPAAAAPKDDAKMKPAAAPAAPSASEAAAMEAYAKMAQPGEHHKLLDRSIGHWTTVTKIYAKPGAPPMESTGTMEASWILGGRYVESVYRGQMMGQAFEGRGIDGYDNEAEQYVSSWVDNMGTGVLLLKGSADAAGKLTVTTNIVDPMTRQKAVYKGVTTPIDADSFRYESILVQPDGKEFKSMETVATRVK